MVWEMEMEGQKETYHRPAAFRITEEFLYCESQAAQRDSQEVQAIFQGPSISCT